MYKDIVNTRRMNESLDDSFTNSVMNTRVPIHFTSDDNRNLRSIAVLLKALSSKWSDFVDEHSEAMDSNTDGCIRNLSSVADKIMGNWDDKIVF